MKGTKVWLLLATGMMVVGIGLASIGTVLGGKWNMGFNLKEFSFTTGSDKIVEDTVKIESFDKLKVDLSTIDIFIRTGKEYSVFYRVPEDSVPDIECKNGTLKIEGKSKVSFFLFGGFTSDEDEYIIVTVPEGSENAFESDIETSTGDIKLENGIYSYEKITSSTGDISLTGVNNDDEWKIDTSTGYLNIKNCTMKSLDSKSSTGDVAISGSKIEKRYDAKLSTGDIQMDNTSMEKIQVKGSTSDITFNNVQVDDIDFDVTTGDIKLLLDGKNEDYSIKLHTSTGDMNIDGIEYDGKNFESQKGSKNIKIETSTGDITINYKN
ncbi:MAG: DUF4097 family beta strand repeat protein [Lachnospiraceae bacterium]|nr:DUF4097 family beta strand repeat protein [Lachnospiraceae bacterium]